MQGTITALITPFLDGALDLEGLRENIRFQIESGVSGLLALGTTGEAPTLTKEEKRRIIAAAVSEVNRRLPVWVGTGSYSTQETIERTQEAHDLGADAALIVTPYYNKPSQEGIFRHFEAVAKATEIPIVVYNIAGRCGVNIETATLKRIATLPRIVGVKEASGSLIQASEAVQELGPDFAVFCGDDALTVPMMAVGAKGVVSVVSNLATKEMVALVNKALEGKFEEARGLHNHLFPLFRAAFLEVNPVPIKEAMSLCGMPSGGVRLPLCSMLPENRARLVRALENLGLLPCDASLKQGFIHGQTQPASHCPRRGVPLSRN